MNTESLLFKNNILISWFAFFLFQSNIIDDKFSYTSFFFKSRHIHILVNIHSLSVKACKGYI